MIRIPGALIIFYIFKGAEMLIKRSGVLVAISFIM